MSTWNNKPPQFSHRGGGGGNWTINSLFEAPPGGGSRYPRNPDLYKTSICDFWAAGHVCHFGDRCWFAHGPDEKRSAPTMQLDSFTNALINGFSSFLPTLGADGLVNATNLVELLAMQPPPRFPPSRAPPMRGYSYHPSNNYGCGGGDQSPFLRAETRSAACSTPVQQRVFRPPSGHSLHPHSPTTGRCSPTAILKSTKMGKQPTRARARRQIQLDENRMGVDVLQREIEQRYSVPTHGVHLNQDVFETPILGAPLQPLNPLVDVSQCENDSSEARSHETSISDLPEIGSEDPVSGYPTSMSYTGKTSPWLPLEDVILVENEVDSAWPTAIDVNALRGVLEDSAAGDSSTFCSDSASSMLDSVTSSHIDDGEEGGYMFELMNSDYSQCDLYAAGGFCPNDKCPYRHSPVGWN